MGSINLKFLALVRLESWYVVNSVRYYLMFTVNTLTICKNFSTVIYGFNPLGILLTRNLINYRCVNLKLWSLQANCIHYKQIESISSRNQPKFQFRFYFRPENYTSVRTFLFTKLSWTELKVKTWIANIYEAQRTRRQNKLFQSFDKMLRPCKTSPRQALPIAR